MVLFAGEGVALMARLTIKLHEYEGHCCCALCQRTAPFPAGPALCLESGAEVVCRECGKKEAPSLVALLDLAEVAQRVGRIARHTLTPSLETLLDLARAAENFSFATSDHDRNAA